MIYKRIAGWKQGRRDLGWHRGTRRDRRMRLNRALKIINDHQEELRRRYGIKSIALFGSVSRNEASETSDLDVLVEFDKPVGLFAFAHTRRYLSELLGCEVDLVTPMALRPEMRERILSEAIHAA